MHIYAPTQGAHQKAGGGGGGCRGFNVYQKEN
jgi:hypothetical protein